MAQLTSDRDRRVLTWLNNADPIAARDAVLRCCSAAPWADAVTTGRPYRSLDDLLKTSDDAVTGLTEHDIEHAIAGHPRIGENSAQRWSRQEQSGTHDASDDLRAELARGNAAYEQRFGRVFLICATGMPAERLLAELHTRLGNDAATERAVVREELRKINRSRLEKLVRS